MRYGRGRSGSGIERGRGREEKLLHPTRVKKEREGKKKFSSVFGVNLSCNKTLPSSPELLFSLPSLLYSVFKGYKRNTGKQTRKMLTQLATFTHHYRFAFVVIPSQSYPPLSPSLPFSFSLLLLSLHIFPFLSLLHSMQLTLFFLQHTSSLSLVLFILYPLRHTPFPLQSPSLPLDTPPFTPVIRGFSFLLHTLFFKVYGIFYRLCTSLFHTYMFPHLSSSTQSPSLPRRLPYDHTFTPCLLLSPFLLSLPFSVQHPFHILLL